MGSSPSQEPVDIKDDQLNALYAKFSDNKEPMDEKGLYNFLEENGIEIPEAAFHVMAVLMDKNEDGKFQPSEFLAFLKIILFTETFEEIIFKCTDLNGNGFISKDELEYFNRRLGFQLEADKIPEKMTFEEFKPLITQYISK